MRPSARDPDREGTFISFYDVVYPDLGRFAQRRTHRDLAEDVVADAFLVGWRRLDELPSRNDDARAWVFGITRNLLLNTQRGEQRRRALGVRLVETTRLPYADHGADPDGDLAVSRGDLATAWSRLPEVHQEALWLVVFEDLRAPQAAAVLGISPVAFRLRLSRARRALRFHLDHLPAPSSRSVGTPEGPPRHEPHSRPAPRHRPCAGHPEDPGRSRPRR